MSLRLQFAAIIAAVALTCVGAVTAVRTVMRGQELEAELATKAHLYAELLARQLVPAVGYDDEQTAREVLESAGSDPDVEEIALYADDGSVIAASQHPPARWEEAPASVIERRTAGAVIVAAPVVTPEGPRATLYLSVGTQRMYAQVRNMVLMTGLLSFGLLALAMVAAWFIAGAATRRIARIAGVADAIAHGDLTAPPLSPGSLDEVGRLTVGFNLMLERVRTEQERLAALVAERTAELSASREQFRQIAETTRAIPFEFDMAQRRFSYVGPQVAAVTGHEVARWFTPGFLDTVLDAEERQVARADILAQLERGQQFDRELRARAADGRWLYLRVSASVTGTLARGLALDVTERKALEERVQQAQRLESVGRLAAGLAHEINTPMQYIGDSVTFAREAWADVMSLVAEYRRASPRVDCEEAIQLDVLAEQAPAAFETAAEGLSRIKEIVKAMRAFAKDGQSTLANLDVREGIESTIVVARSEYQAVADVDVQLDDAPPVRARPAELNQVWLALVRNAAQAITDRGAGRGRIAIRSRVEANRVLVSVSDDGCGIQPYHHGHIFEQFFTTRPPGHGRGQSLAAARATLKTLGGEIWFETRPGAGTTFHVALPHAGDQLAAVA